MVNHNKSIKAIRKINQIFRKVGVYELSKTPEGVEVGYLPDSNASPDTPYQNVQALLRSNSFLEEEIIPCGRYEVDGDKLHAAIGKGKLSDFEIASDGSTFAVYHESFPVFMFKRVDEKQPWSKESEIEWLRWFTYTNDTQGYKPFFRDGMSMKDAVDILKKPGSTLFWNSGLKTFEVFDKKKALGSIKDQGFVLKPGITFKLEGNLKFHMTQNHYGIESITKEYSMVQFFHPVSLWIN